MGIRYRKLASGTVLEQNLEADYVCLLKGLTIPVHAHRHTSALCLVLKGSGVLTLNEDAFAVNEGDVVGIPAGAYHGFRAGAHGLEFLSIQSPPIGEDYIFPATPQPKKK